jgi:hypothetical protein
MADVARPRIEPLFANESRVQGDAVPNGADVDLELPAGPLPRPARPRSAQAAPPRPLVSSLASDAMEAPLAPARLHVRPRRDEQALTSARATSPLAADVSNPRESRPGSERHEWLRPAGDGRESDNASFAARPTPLASDHNPRAAGESRPDPGRQERRMQATAPQPSVRVTIGRVEVRAVFPAPTAATSQPRRSPELTLEDYVKQRSEGRR